MTYENDISRILDQFDFHDQFHEFKTAPINCRVEFWIRDIVDYKIKFGSNRLLLSITTTNSNIYKKAHVLDYLHARLVMKYKGTLITRTGILITAEQKKVHSLKNEKTTCKRMVTKIQNQLIKYEAQENKSLLPYLDNPKYIAMKEKLDKYSVRLLELDKMDLYNK